MFDLIFETLGYVTKRKYDNINASFHQLKREILNGQSDKKSRATGVTFEVYKAKNKEWRWRMISANRRIIADSGEGYKTKTALLDTLGLIKDIAEHTQIKTL